MDEWGSLKPLNSEYLHLIRHVINLVGALGSISLLGGIFLAVKGYAESNMLLGIGGGCVTGLLGLISMRGGKAEDIPNIPPEKTTEQTTTTETTTTT